MSQPINKKTVVIIGGGFAGLSLVKHLDTTFFDILLIDQLNHYQFQPLFYQVAASQLEPSSISFPFRKILQHKHIRFTLAEVILLKPDEKKIETSVGSFHYDYLVIATGCHTNFFGNMKIMQHALTLKSTYDAISIRNYILQTFENVASATAEERIRLLNIVIVGAGPTGVELSGALAEIKKNILPNDYPDIDLSELKIILLEAETDILSAMGKYSSQMATKYLKNMEVTIRTGQVVTDYDGQKVTLKNGEVIPCHTLIWVAGVSGNIIEGLSRDTNQAAGQRIRVTRTGQVMGHEFIYAVGDIAYMETPKYPKGHPQVANVAIKQAVNTAKNINRLQTGKSMKNYEYLNLGFMATVGKNKAIVDFHFVRFGGRVAWFIWMLLHIMLILSVRSKLIIFINWAWLYFTNDTSLRLILQSSATNKK